MNTPTPVYALWHDRDGWLVVLHGGLLFYSKSVAEDWASRNPGYRVVELVENVPDSLGDSDAKMQLAQDIEQSRGER